MTLYSNITLLILKHFLRREERDCKENISHLMLELIHQITALRISRIDAYSSSAGKHWLDLINHHPTASALIILFLICCCFFKLFIQVFANCGQAGCTLEPIKKFIHDKISLFPIRSPPIYFESKLCNIHLANIVSLRSSSFTSLPWFGILRLWSVDKISRHDHISPVLKKMFTSFCHRFSWKAYRT